MITFKYEDSATTVRVRCNGDGLGRVVESFKEFLIHAGFHPDNVEGIEYEPTTERQELQLDLRQGPQMDLFPDTRAEGDFT